MYTAVGIYLRLRDRFRDTILLESSDYNAADNSFSIIGINAIAGIEISNINEMEFKFPNEEPQKKQIPAETAAKELWNFMQTFEVMHSGTRQEKMAQGLFGYTAYDGIQLFEDIRFAHKKESSLPDTIIPLVRYRLYQYVIVMNHFKNELFICENKVKGIEGNVELIENIILNKDVPVYPYQTIGDPLCNMSDEDYESIVKKGMKYSQAGDVFQIVLSRRYAQKFIGDDFNVYRALRNINPSPYLFYFDYGDYRLIGSSPESQLRVNQHKAFMHPIAGTVRRTGNDEADEIAAKNLLKDPKENAEHVMLVDLARNDLSRSGSEVEVSSFCKVQYFSHVIHLVSEVQSTIPLDTNPFQLLGSVFPAGTLSGAPKFRAMQLIDQLEPDHRSYYGGCIGYIGFDGNVNHAIMIRTFLSKENFLHYRAGAGVVISSQPQSELQEVNNKLAALTLAVQAASSVK